MSRLTWRVPDSELLVSNEPCIKQWPCSIQMRCSPIHTDLFMSWSRYWYRSVQVDCNYNRHSIIFVRQIEPSSLMSTLNASTRRLIRLFGVAIVVSRSRATRSNHNIVIVFRNQCCILCHEGRMPNAPTHIEIDIAGPLRDRFAAAMSRCDIVRSKHQIQRERKIDMIWAGPNTLNLRRHDSHIHSMEMSWFTSSSSTIAARGMQLSCKSIFIYYVACSTPCRQKCTFI